MLYNNQENNVLMNSLKDSHIALVQEASNGDSNAMDTLYSLYSRAMLNTAFRIVNTVEDAEDILQESFVKAFSNLHKFENRSSFGAWLKRIVVNKSIDLLKKKERLRFQSLTDKEEFIMEAFILPNDDDNNDKVKEVNEALLLLPDGYRTVLSLYLLEGFDHNEISQILKINVSTSISQLSRAKKKLISIIENKST